VVTAYFDSSALVPLVLIEPATERAKTLWDAAGRALSARLVYPEVRAALARARRTGRLTSRQLRDAVSTFEAFYVRIDLIDLDDDLARRAGDLAETHGLRGGDAVHLAAATQLGDADVVVVVGDAALLGAAAAEGMAVADVA